MTLFFFFFSLKYNWIYFIVDDIIFLWAYLLLLLLGGHTPSEAWCLFSFFVLLIFTLSTFYSCFCICFYFATLFFTIFCLLTHSLTRSFIYALFFFPLNRRSLILSTKKKERKKKLCHSNIMPHLIAPSLSFFLFKKQK